MEWIETSLLWIIEGEYKKKGEGSAGYIILGMLVERLVQNLRRKEARQYTLS